MTLTSNVLVTSPLLLKILDGYSERVALEGDIPSGDDIAKTILFLASDASSHITGQEIVVDGGLAFQNKDAMI